MKILSYISVCLVLLVFTVLPVRAVSGNIDPTFNASVTEGLIGAVNKTIIQSDGKIIAVGQFQRSNGIRTESIARFNADGTLDTSFLTGTGANLPIRAIALQADGKIIIGGSFTVFNNQTVRRIARLNTNGTIDSAFDISVNFNNQIEDIAVQADGKILVGGSFTSPGSRLVRLNSNGSFDTFFATFNGQVNTICLLPNGKFLVGGTFTFPGTTTPPRQRIARFNSDGSIDTTFNAETGADNVVNKIVVQSDGKIIAGGSFRNYNGAPAKGVVRINDNGSLDATFNLPDPSSQNSLIVSSLAVQPDSKLLVGYYFNDNLSNPNRVVRFNSDATLDQTFISGVVEDKRIVWDIQVFADGKFIIGGNFITYNNQNRLRLIKLNSDGSFDTSFNASVSVLATVFTVKHQSDGKIIIGGDFSFVNGIKRRSLARINADGSLDESFGQGSALRNSAVVYAVLIQPDGKIVVGGSAFDQYGTVSVSRLFRVNANGSLDISFQSDTATISIVQVLSLALQADGKVLAGGFMPGIFNGESGSNIAVVRFNSNGMIDTAFNILPINGNVRAILVQPDNKIIFGGSFFSEQGSPAIAREGIARANSDGTLDTAFTSGSGSVMALAQLPDGKVYAGGAKLFRYTSEGIVDPTFSTGTFGFSILIRALAVQANGKVIIGGDLFSYNGIPVNRIARVNSDGSYDSTFNPGTGVLIGEIDAVDVQENGKIIAGGRFQQFNDTDKLSLVRLQSDSSFASKQFDFDGDGKADISVFRPENGSWYIQQSQAGFTGLAFGLYTDKLVPADYDGDGKTDVAVVRNGVWYLLRSQAGFTGINFGVADDVPVPADYDGDGKTDIAVFRPSNGYWYILQSSNNQFIATFFGISTDKPVPADYDGDGKADIAVNRNGNWYIQRSQLGFIGTLFGDANDKLVPADYDGDGKTDIAVFRPSNGNWYLQQSSAGFAGIAFGLGTDIPVAADYDGDGKADVAVVRNGNWYINRSTQGFTGTQFGTSTDLPIPSAFVR